MTVILFVPRWRAVVGEETDSDHRYVRFELSSTADGVPARPNSPEPHQALKRLNQELLMKAAIIQAWAPAPEGPVDWDAEADWFRDVKSSPQPCEAHRQTTTNLRDRTPPVIPVPQEVSPS